MASTIQPPEPLKNQKFNDCDEKKENILLEELKDWLKCNPKITSVKCDDNLKVLYFLRCTKHDLERSKKKLEGFNTMVLERTEWFTNRDPFLPELQELLELGVFLPIKKKDNLNRQVVVIRTAVHNPNKHSQNDVFKCGMMVLDLLLRLESSISNDGIVAIFDMKGVTLAHALQLTPTLIKRAVESWQLYPCKTKLLEFVNVPAHVNLVLNTFRLFMTPKMKSRVVVRRKSSEVNTELPIDLGGGNENLSYKELAKEWKALIENNCSFFNEN